MAKMEHMVRVPPRIRPAMAVPLRVPGRRSATLSNERESLRWKGSLPS